MKKRPSPYLPPPPSRVITIVWITLKFLTIIIRNLRPLLTISTLDQVPSSQCSIFPWYMLLWALSWSCGHCALVCIVLSSFVMVPFVHHSVIMLYDPYACCITFKWEQYLPSTKNSFSICVLWFLWLFQKSQPRLWYHLLCQWNL